VRKHLFLAGLLGVVMITAGCVKFKPGGQANISMTGASFVGNTNITIKAGQFITFTDPAGSGGPHRLSMGLDGNYELEVGAPDELNQENGVDFALGTTKTYTFAQPGTYHITCQIHPSMNLTIQVVPSH
jgi:plastocyanin